MNARFLSLVLAVLVGAVAFSCKKSSDGGGAMSVAAAVGNVKIVGPQGEREPRAGDMVGQGDTIVTGKSSLVDVLCSDRGIVRIGENSSVKMAFLSGQAGADRASLAVSKGKVFVTMAKFNKGSSFEVSSSTAVAAVRGTSFRVVADEDSSRIVVLRGKVSVRPVSDGKAADREKVVEANEAVSMDADLAKNVSAGRAEVQVAPALDSEITEIRSENSNITSSASFKSLSPDVQSEAASIFAEEKESVSDGGARQGATDVQREPR